MNFATLKGLTIPEGMVTQIADVSGTYNYTVNSNVGFSLESKYTVGNGYGRIEITET